MGNETSRQTRSNASRADRQGRNNNGGNANSGGGNRPPPGGLPNHLASQYTNHRQSQQQRTDGGAQQQQQQARQQQQQQQAPPQGGGGGSQVAQQQQQQGGAGQNQGENRQGVQEGQMIKMLATVEPSTVTFHPDTGILNFFISSTCQNVMYEIHTGVKQSVRSGEVVYTPNQPKEEPLKTLIRDAQDSKAINIKVDMSLMRPQEIRYDSNYEKQKPCVIVLRYYTKADNNAKEEHTEHTAVDLSENPKQRVISQIITTGGSAYMVENLYDVGMPGEVVVAPTIEPHEGEEDDDGLCVVCWTEAKDTAVMPCRHMCLCKECAEKLMKQSPKCPVCRGTISTLLHMPSAAVQKS